MFKKEDFLMAVSTNKTILVGVLINNEMEYLTIEFENPLLIEENFDILLKKVNDK